MIILSLLLFGCNAANLTCEELDGSVHVASNLVSEQGMANNIVDLMNKAKQELHKLEASQKGKSGNRAAKFALAKSLKLLDVLISQILNLAKFFLSDKKNELLEEDANKNSKEDAWDFDKRPSNTEKWQEKGGSKKNEQDPFDLPDQSRDDVKELKKKEKAQSKLAKKLEKKVQHLEEKVKRLKNEEKELKKKAKDTKSNEQRKYNSELLLWECSKDDKAVHNPKFWRSAESLIDQDNAEKLAELFAANASAIKKTVADGNYQPTLKALIVVCPATQYGPMDDVTRDITNKALFKYNYMGLLVKRAYDSGSKKCLSFFEKEDPIGMNDFACIKKNVGGWRSYASTIVLPLKDQITQWESEQGIASALSGMLCANRLKASGNS